MPEAYLAVRRSTLIAGAACTTPEQCGALVLRLAGRAKLLQHRLASAERDEHLDAIRRT